jgi:photosystem II stability/assembly factor-like uncharacterized protein
MVVAGLIYLHPAFLSLPKGPAAPPSPSPSMVPAGFSHTYDFISATTGWALLVDTSAPARLYVYRTTDGAKHWNMQLTADAAGAGFGEIKFFDNKRGVIWIGSPIQLYRTSDGGTHWDPVSLPPYQANEVTFSDPSHIWLLASEPDPGLLPHFFATTDGGNTWAELAWPKGAPWANNVGGGHLQFRRPGEGWLAAAGASEPAVYSTADGGASWERHALPRPSGADFAVDTFVGLVPGVGVIVYIDYGIATKSLAYTSFDVGNTWRSVTPPPNTPAQNVTFQDSTHWWATGSGTVWKSSDAGQSWTSVYQKFDKWVEGPQFIDAKHGWAQLYVPGKSARPPSGLAMTSDGGLRWTQVDAPGPQ